MSVKEAMFWKKREKGAVKCFLCRQECLIADGKRGLCRVRENRNGVLNSLVYGRATAASADPIEKKPLYHFLPGTRAFSIATRGCNFRCLHCQNCHIAHPSPEDDFTADRLVEPEQAVRMAAARDCRTVAYTYTEPTIFFEYAYDTARLATEKGMKNIFVTNAYIGSEALETITPFLHGANIDLKAFSDETYRKLCAARLQPVLDNIRLYYESGIWIEITTLVIPGWNDSDGELENIAGFIASVDTAIPWHVTRFSPAYRLADAPPTPVETLERALEAGRKAGLKYVYIGNIPHREATRTTCPECGAAVIDRSEFGLRPSTLADNHCPKCGYEIEGVWE
ncbi:MAG: AmmeMemoRadiSam system radical SAM enzyme [Kiritimatiellia bacterium]